MESIQMIINYKKAKSYFKIVNLIGKQKLLKNTMKKEKN